jgi:F-type H+-transporting ATPase subunit delta
MNDGLIPTRYARALYKFAMESDSAAQVYGEVKQLSKSFTDITMQRTVDNPFIAIADKEKVLLSAAGAQKDGCLDKFVLMVIRHNRENFMREIILQYGKIYRERNNIAQVEIVTASKMPDAKIAEIADVVKTQLAGKTIEETHTVNPELIGGFLVKVDNIVLDATIKNELKKLRLKLLSN